MIQSKSDLLFYKKADCLANINRDTCSSLRMRINVWYGNDSYRFLLYMIALRNYEYAINCLKGLSGVLRRTIAKIKWHRLGAKLNVNILPNVVGYGFRCPHLAGGGIIINCKSIGCNCTANTGVIVGNNSKGGMPIIGDNVELTIGSKVIGGVHIGNNVIVAPNSVVVKDVPDNAVVSGVPAKIIKINGKTN